MTSWFHAKQSSGPVGFKCEEKSKIQKISEKSNRDMVNLVGWRDFAYAYDGILGVCECLWAV